MSRSVSDVIGLNAPTVFAQWAVGLLIWLVFVGSRVDVPFGFRWVFRTFGVLVGGMSVAIALATGWVWNRDGFVALMVIGILFGLVHSCRSAFGQHDMVERRDRHVDSIADTSDMVAACVGAAGILGSALHGEGPVLLSLVRFGAGTLLLGALTTAMIFGHRYLAKQYLGREALMVSANTALVVWPFAVAVYLLPTGMVSVFTGAVDDGYAGIMGWMWAMCAVATGALLYMAKVILRDERHQVVASATGVIYLAGLTGFGVDLIARAVLGS